MGNPICCIKMVKKIGNLPFCIKKLSKFWGIPIAFFTLATKKVINFSAIPSEIFG